MSTTTSVDGAVIGAVVGGVAGQPVHRVARALVEDAADQTRAASVCGNPDARPGKGVEAHARFGGVELLSPLVMPGECQLVIGLEPLEALRIAVRYFTPEMHVLSLTEAVMPSTVLHKGAVYPDTAAVAKDLESAGAQVTWVDGGVAEDAIEALLSRAREATDRRA